MIKIHVFRNFLLFFCLGMKFMKQLNHKFELTLILRLDWGNFLRNETNEKKPVENNVTRLKILLDNLKIWLLFVRNLKVLFLKQILWLKVFYFHSFYELKEIQLLLKTTDSFKFEKVGTNLFLVVSMLSALSNFKLGTVHF